MDPSGYAESWEKGVDAKMKDMFKDLHRPPTQDLEDSLARGSQGSRPALRPELHQGLDALDTLDSDDDMPPLLKGTPRLPPGLDPQVLAHQYAKACKKMGHPWCVWEPTV